MIEHDKHFYYIIKDTITLLKEIHLKMG